MAFKKDYSQLKETILDTSLQCLDILDVFCKNKRDNKSRGYFCYRCDPETNKKYYTLLDLPYKFELGSFVTRTDDELIITHDNTKYIFKFHELDDVAKCL